MSNAQPSQYLSTTPEPDGPSFRVPVIRIPSKAQNPKLLLTNPGGPGISGVNDLRTNREYFEKFSDAYTVVSFDPRGVGASVPAIQCLDDQQRQAIFNQPSAPTSDADMKRAKELAIGIGDSCKRQFGDALAHIGTADVARDMDEIRKAMGFDQINYLGFSYGTFLGAVYADMFPKQTDRVVLDSVMDPMLDYQEVRHGQAQGMQLSITAFVEDCLRRPDCPLSGPSDQALQQISQLIGTLDGQPYVGADGRTLSGARMLALVESSQYFPESGWPTLRETLRHAVAKQWPAVLDAAYSPKLMVNPADSEYLSVVCIDFATRPRSGEAQTPGRDVGDGKPDQRCQPGLVAGAVRDLAGAAGARTRAGGPAGGGAGADSQHHGRPGHAAGVGAVASWPDQELDAGRRPGPGPHRKLAERVRGEHSRRVLDEGHSASGSRLQLSAESVIGRIRSE